MTKTIAALVSGFLILGALIALVAGPASAQYSSIAQMQESGLPISGGTMLGDINLGGYDLKYVDDIYSPAPTTNVAPTSRDFFSQAAWSQATGANQTGADIKLIGGIGTRQVTCSAFDADAANDTYTPTVNGVAGQVLTAKNGGAVAHQFNCQTSNAACCLALKTAFNLESYGATASCVNATCSDGKVYIDPTAASTYSYTHAIANSAGAVFGSVTSGTDGTTRLSMISILGPASAVGITLQASNGQLYVYSGVPTNNVAFHSDTILSSSNTNYSFASTSAGGGVGLSSTGQFNWAAGTTGAAAPDTGISRTGVGLVKLTNGSTGSAVGFMLSKQEAAVPVEPVACGATTTGTVQYVDDNNDGAIAQICICVSTNDAAYDWVQLNSPGTACGFY